MDYDYMGSIPFFADAGFLDGFYGGGGHGYIDDYGPAVSQQLGAGAGASSSSSPAAVVLDGGGGGERLLDAAAAAAGSTEEEAPKRNRRDEKAAMALKSHSEAERRRRERINAHLATLRSMLPPCSDKMDKAALLAEVIAHVKKLKASAARIRDHCAAVPADADDVAVELVQAAPPPPSASGGGALVRATLSCDDGADVFADVKHALRPLRLRVVGSEVTTLGGRVRFTFLIAPSCGGGGGDAGAVVDSVHQALQSVLDRANSALEFAPRASLLNKRRRVSTFESSSSSS